MVAIWSAEIVLRDSGSEAAFRVSWRVNFQCSDLVDLRTSLKFLPDSLNGPPRRWRPARGRHELLARHQVFNIR